MKLCRAVAVLENQARCNRHLGGARKDGPRVLAQRGADGRLGKVDTISRAHPEIRDVRAKRTTRATFEISTTCG